MIPVKQRWSKVKCSLHVLSCIDGGLAVILVGFKSKPGFQPVGLFYAPLGENTTGARRSECAWEFGV